MSDRPNLLVLMSDQHSPAFLGCYGNEIVRTPNLDRLAREGVRFTNTYCPAPLCVPSRASFMTCRTPTHNRVWNNQHTLPSGVPTWAHALGAAGYETALIGRMHFVGADQRHGFEKRPLGEYSAHHPGAPEQGGPRWQKLPPITSGQRRPCVEIAGKGTTTYQWFDEHVAGAACEYLREKADGDARPFGGAQDRPFAAVAGFVLPHCPFVAPKELFDYYYERVDIPKVEESQPATVTRFRDVRDILDPPLPEERVRVARAAYYALCEHFDRQVGVVLDCLDATGLAGNTVVVYTSDHGEMGGEHGCWWKSNYYEHSAGVPMIARVPGSALAGTVCDDVCNVYDIGATLIEAGGAEPLPNVDGRSLWPTLHGSRPADWTNETFCELVDVRGASPNFPSRMIRSGKWKLWVYADSAGLPPAMFDLDADPGELNDLGDDPAYADIRAELLKKVYDGWDPEQVGRDAHELDQGHKAISASGKTVLPVHEDSFPAPPPELEDDIELL
jgi:choline-sulfatase